MFVLHHVITKLSVCTSQPRTFFVVFYSVDTASKLIIMATTFILFITMFVGFFTTGGLTLESVYNFIHFIVKCSILRVL
ncbi:hypothetical protein DM02DRAFT_412203 [Periconia macrospinosa]|uniref:Uncharacterized protein n=1 Tax=Periconia macrospinosa TaxID=97972 RepID=A0A2V1D0H7_9PLEO|nr:hypothetical protein DM02DRAFT_412203 [Periconia macrospinosa]